MNYYIQGNKEKADEIKAAFDKLGCKNTNAFNFEGDDKLYFTFNDKVDWSCYKPFIDIIKTHPNYKELELPVVPKFKVGDLLQSGSYFTKILSINLEEERYYCDNRIISFKNQDLWHLVPKPHYDIKNFKPFQKVLVRDDDNECWMPSLFGWFDSGLQDGKFVCGTSDWEQCIPFNDDTKHLLGTTDMCSEEYINW